MEPPARPAPVQSILIGIDAQRSKPEVKPDHGFPDSIGLPALAKALLMLGS